MSKKRKILILILFLVGIGLISSGIYLGYFNGEVDTEFNGSDNDSKNTGNNISISPTPSATPSSTREPRTPKSIDDKIETYPDLYRFDGNSYNLDKSYVFKTTENPIIAEPYSISKEETNSTGELELYKISNSSDYIKMLTSEEIEVSNYKKINKYEIKLVQSDEENRSSYFEIPAHLEKGYYVAKYRIADNKDKNDYSYVPIIISDISAYVANAERDTLVWLLDKDGKPVKGAKVYFNKKTVNTDKDGIARINDIKNNDNDHKKFMKITDDDGNELIVLLEVFNQKNYYNAFIYSDKPIYMPNDKVYVWGYIPKDLFIDKIDYSKLELKSKIGYGTNAQEILVPIKVSDTGVFVTSFDIKNASERGYVELSYNGVILDNFGYSIYKYEKSDVEYAITTNKNNYMYGEKVTATASAKKLTGEAVSGQLLYVYFQKDEFSCITNENGTCDILIDLANYKTEKNVNENIIEEKIAVSPKQLKVSYNYSENLSFGKGPGDIVSLSRFNIVYNDIFLDVEKDMKGDDLYYYNLTTKKISVNDDDEIVYKNVDYDVNVVVNEVVCSRSKIEGYHSYSRTCDLIDTDNVYKEVTYNVKGGHLVVKDLNFLSTLTYTLNSGTSTNYYFTFTATGSSNHTKTIKENGSYKGLDNYFLVEGVSDYRLASFSPWSDSLYGQGYIPIAAHRFINGKYSIGDKINTDIYKNSSTKINPAKKITYFFKEKILDVFFDSKELKFEEKYFPGSDMGSAYYDKELNNICLVKRDYLDYRETDRLVDIKLKTDKKTYKPNDEVTLNITVTDKDGKGVKTDTLISVVDEAIFLIEDDRNEQIARIYNDKRLPFYQYATYQPLQFMSGGAGDAVGGGSTLNNGDTIFFDNVKTDSNGKATVKFKLNKLETKFRITAISANTKLYYGTNVLKIVSKNK